MAIIGGGVIKDYEFSKAWGISPSAAKGKVVMDTIGGAPENIDLEAGDFVVFSFGAYASFTGIVSEVGETVHTGEGRMADFTVLDNRIRLDWQMVFGAWNIEDDMRVRPLGQPESPSTGSDSGSNGSDGVDFSAGLGSPAAVVGAPSITDPGQTPTRRRRYRHRLPQYWESGVWTWTDEPYTAREILNSAFNNAWGNYGFTRNYHSDLNDLILTGLDYSEGVKLSALISDINSKAGLDIVLSGTRTLVWGRKGTGSVPTPTSYSDQRSNGSSLTSVDTAVRVVGDRIRVQVLNMELEPDWREGWEDYIDQLAWHRAVKDAFELPSENQADQATLAARAKSCTVYEFAKATDNAALLDARPYGLLSRNNIPAWTYITELVYRSYRIPPDTLICGVPISSLELADTLLCATEVNGEGLAAEQRYRPDPLEYYPAARAQAIIRGQPLDLVDARSMRAFFSRGTRDYRNEWSDAPEFEVDEKNFSLRFRSPVFIDGDPDENKSIFSQPNKGQGGAVDVSERVAENSDYLAIVVPNPDYEITAASVKASFCFVFGHLHRDFGSGARRGALRVPGLGLELLDITGAAFAGSGTGSFTTSDLRLPGASGRNFRELLYDDGSSAMDKLDEAGSSAIQQSALLQKGGFTNHGSAGTVITPAVDRITVNISSGIGITEKVEYAKARTTSAFIADASLRRIQRGGDWFPGQQQILREVRQLKLESDLLRGLSPHDKNTTHQNMPDIFRVPIGGQNQDTLVIRDVNGAAPEGAWKPGHLVWLDDQGFPTSTGGSFGGVVVSGAGASEGSGRSGDAEISIVQSGIVPVLISDIVQGNGVVVADPGSNTGSSIGSTVIGTLCHASPVPLENDEEVYGLVRLGADSVAQPGRFIIRFSSEEQRIYVSVGSVAFIEMYGSTDEDVEPVVPTLNGISLDGSGSQSGVSEKPFFSVDEESLEPSVPYRVRIVLDPEEPRLKISEPPGSMAEDEDSEEDEEEFDTFLIGTITLKSPPSGSSFGGLLKDEIDQKWISDLVWPKEQSSSSSSSSSSGSSSSDSSESSVSSESSDSGSDSSSSSSSSSESSSSVSSASSLSSQSEPSEPSEPSDPYNPPDSSESESSAESSEGGSGGGSDPSGSEKSTAIVPASWSPHGFAALFTMEAPEVLFEDVMRVKVRGKRMSVPIDPRFLMVCERGSVVVVSAVADKPAMVGAKVIKGEVVFDIDFSDTLPNTISLKLSGTRRGFKNVRFPLRDREQFDANERHLNSAYPMKKLD